MGGLEIAALASLLMNAGAMYAGNKKQQQQQMVEAAQTEGALKQEAQKQFGMGQQSAMNDVINSYRQMLVG
jgi:hypothetical protein